MPLQAAVVSLCVGSGSSLTKTPDDEEHEEEEEEEEEVRSRLIRSPGRCTSTDY